MRRVTSAALLAVTTLFTTAMTQSQGSDAERLASRLDSQVRDAVIAIVDSARRSELPTEPLVDKALELTQKRADASKITASVSKMAQDLARARRALGPGFSGKDITAAMFAIRAGVDVKQLERLRAARTGQRIATAIYVLEQLGRLRVDADTAATVIVNLLLASATDEHFIALQSDIERDMAAGTPAGSAITVRGQQLATMIAAETANGGAPASTLPSGLGSTRPADPAANAALGGGAAGNRTQGGSKPAPAGKPAQPKKP